MGNTLVLLVYLLPLPLQSILQLLSLVLGQRVEGLRSIRSDVLDHLVLLLNAGFYLIQVLWDLAVVLLVHVLDVLFGNLGDGEDVLHGVGDDKVLP